MLILAVDPGPTESAYVLWDGKELHEFGKEPNDKVLAYIYASRNLVSLDRMVVEMIGHYGKGMPAGREVFDTCIFIGRFMEAFGAEKTDTILRATIKTNLCGTPRAKDANVRQAIIDRFGGKDKAVGRKASPGPLFGVSGDCWAALAVALTWCDQKTASGERPSTASPVSERFSTPPNDFRPEGEIRG